MTNIELVEKLKYLLTVPTKYCNKYPYNVGYVYEDGSRSFDCWNLIKSLLNGYDVYNTTKGYYQRSLSVTGDVDGAGLLRQCHDTSNNFSAISVAGTYLLYQGATHAGIYVGEFQKDGFTYNVIECTSAWTKGVLASWVDADGTRRKYKGCTGKIGKWDKYGLLNLVEYSNAHANDTPKKEESTEIIHTVVAGDTLWGISRKYLGVGTKWKSIYDYNGLKSTIIRIGQKIKIPRGV